MSDFSDLFLAHRWMLKVLGPLFAVWVLAFVLLPWLAHRRRKAAAVKFSNIRTLLRLRPSKSLILRRLFMGLRLVTVALLMIAMARPQTGRTQTQVRTEGIDIVLVIDTSGSMQALDLDANRKMAERRNRLEVVKAVVARFIEKRANDQLGLVVFGSEAFTQCPLTLDHGIVATFLERVKIGMAGEATAIGNALGTAVKRLKDSEAESKVVVLLTDGKSNAGFLAPGTAAELAQSYGVKVYVIGAGTRGKAPVFVDTMFGRQVQYIEADIDEEAMTRIAETTGGAYFRAEDERALAEIYDQIDELERTEITTLSYMEYDERFTWFVVPALLLLLLELILLGTRFRKVP